MISNQILQSTIEGLKGITRVELAVIDTDGKVLASTFKGTIDYQEAAINFTKSPADSQEISGYQFFKVYDELQIEYILVAQGTTEDSYTVGKIAAFQIQNLLIAYKERFDKDNFSRNFSFAREGYTRPPRPQNDREGMPRSFDRAPQDRGYDRMAERQDRGFDRAPQDRSFDRMSRERSGERPPFDRMGADRPAFDRTAC